MPDKIKPVTDQQSFNASAREVLELLKKGTVNIDLCVSIIEQMRFWFLGEILENQTDTKQFERCSGILNHLDNLLTLAYAKDRLQRFGVSSDKQS